MQINSFKCEPRSGNKYKAKQINKIINTSKHSNENKVPEKDTTRPCTASFKCACRTFDAHLFIGFTNMTSSVVANDTSDMLDFPAISAYGPE